MSELSAEAMNELREHLELDVVVEETTAEELNLAIQAIREVEAAVEDVTPSSSTSSGKKGKGPCTSGEPKTPRKRINDDYDDDDDFQNPPPRKTPRYTSGGKKNMAIVRKNLRSPSPSPSTSSTTSSGPNHEWLNFMEEEEQRRTAEKTRREEWHRRAAGEMILVKKKMNKALERVSVVKGELIALRNQKENLRDEIRVLEERLRSQIRNIEERELVLEREKQSSLQAAKRYEAIVTRFNEMSI